MTQMPQAPNPYGSPPPSPPGYAQPQQGYAPPPPKVTSGLWYLLPLLCLVGGGWAAAHYGRKAYVGAKDFLESMQDLSVPGVSTVSVPKDGVFAVYLFPLDREAKVGFGEYKAEFASLDPGLVVTIKERAPAQGTQSNTTINGRAFTAYWEVQAEGAGQLQVTIQPADSETPATAAEGSFSTLITDAQAFEFVTGIFIVIGAALGGGLLALITFIVVLVMRSNSKGRLRQYQVAHGQAW